MRTLVEGTDHGRGPQWVKLSDDDAQGSRDEVQRCDVRGAAAPLPGSNCGVYLGHRLERAWAVELATPAMRPTAGRCAPRRALVPQAARQA
jgi:hypothetical protein